MAQRTPEFRISLAKIRELYELHGINYLAPIPDSDRADPEFYAKILVTVLGKEGFDKYASSHDFTQTFRDIFRPTVALPGEPEYEPEADAVEAATDKS